MADNEYIWEGKLYTEKEIPDSCKHHYDNLSRDIQKRYEHFMFVRYLGRLYLIPISKRLSGCKDLDDSLRDIISAVYFNVRDLVGAEMIMFNGMYSQESVHQGETAQLVGGC